MNEVTGQVCEKEQRTTFEETFFLHNFVNPSDSPVRLGYVIFHPAPSWARDALVKATGNPSLEECNRHCSCHKCAMPYAILWVLRVGSLIWVQ